MRSIVKVSHKVLNLAFRTLNSPNIQKFHKAAVLTPVILKPFSFSTSAGSDSFSGVVTKHSVSAVAREPSGDVSKRSVSSPPNAPRRALDEYELSEDEEVDDLEEMFIDGPAGIEWGGPTRGGRRPEPTRYGDWERKGRVSDF